METALSIVKKDGTTFSQTWCFDTVMLLACWMKVMQSVWVGERSVYHQFVGLKRLDVTQTLVVVHIAVGWCLLDLFYMSSRAG